MRGLKRGVTVMSFPMLMVSIMVSLGFAAVIGVIDVELFSRVQAALEAVR
jgi:hypothetical protein